MCARQRLEPQHLGTATVGLLSQHKCGRWATGWTFYCSVDWSVLEEEGQQGPDPNNPVTVWCNYITE
eukprot:12901324-Prorocentrum_lima.AAC.1